MAKKYSIALIEVETPNIQTYLPNKRIASEKERFSLQLITKINEVDGEIRYNNPMRFNQYFTDANCTVLARYETMQEIGRLQDIFWNNLAAQQ